MKLSEYVTYDAVGLAELVARGEVAGAELETAALEAVAAVNPLVNAVVETWPAETAEGVGEASAGGAPLAACALPAQGPGRVHGRQAGGAGQPTRRRQCRLRRTRT